jgi:hypothetical protein
MKIVAHEDLWLDSSELNSLVPWIYLDQRIPNNGFHGQSWRNQCNVHAYNVFEMVLLGLTVGSSAKSGNFLVSMELPITDEQMNDPNFSREMSNETNVEISLPRNPHGDKFLLQMQWRGVTDASHPAHGWVYLNVKMNVTNSYGPSPLGSHQWQGSRIDNFWINFTSLEHLRSLADRTIASVDGSSLANQNLPMFWVTHLASAIRKDKREANEEDRTHVMHAIMHMDVKAIMKLGRQLLLWQEEEDRYQKENGFTFCKPCGTYKCTPRKRSRLDKRDWDRDWDISSPR